MIGGILGARFGIDGQLIIAEGETQRQLQVPQHVLTLRDAATADSASVPTPFEATAWRDEAKAPFAVSLGPSTLTVRVDRYYPDAVVTERVLGDSPSENPAVRLRLRHGERSPGQDPRRASP